MGRTQMSPVCAQSTKTPPTLEGFDEQNPPGLKMMMLDSGVGNECDRNPYLCEFPTQQCIGQEFTILKAACILKFRAGADHIGSCRDSERPCFAAGEKEVELGQMHSDVKPGPPISGNATRDHPPLSLLSRDPRT